MSHINEKENAVLLVAGFTQREINTQGKKFFNLFRVAPELVPMERHREWVDLTPEEIDDLVAYPWGETKDWVAAVAAKLKEKNA